MRQCVACRASRPKKELVRVVRTPEGVLEIDSTGKKPGRGAYLCASRTCVKQALLKRQLERALTAPLSPEERAHLETYAETLPETIAPATTS